MLETPYIERFGATGVPPEDVDYVFCTHLHHDHCGWNKQLRDRLARAIETRRRIAALCARRGALVIPAHFPAPHAGWARRDNDKTTFEPLAR